MVIVWNILFVFLIFIILIFLGRDKWVGLLIKVMIVFLFCNVLVIVYFIFFDEWFDMYWIGLIILIVGLVVINVCFLEKEFLIIFFCWVKNLLIIDRICMGFFICFFVI